MDLDLLVVAVSRWADGRSVIGLRTDGKGFVRLVAPTPEGILLPMHYRIEGGVVPRGWDLIRVSAPWRDHQRRQPENRVVDLTPWELLERPASQSFDKLIGAVACSGPMLFGDRARSQRDEGGTPPDSVALVYPEFSAGHCLWHEESGKLRPRLRFDNQGQRYDLPLSDHHFAARILSLGEGEYSLHQMGCRTHHGLGLVVTLGESFRGWRYKTVAGLISLRHGRAMPRNTPSAYLTRAAGA